MLNIEMQRILLMTVSLILISNSINALHIKETWSTKKFFKFITRFGFQQTQSHDESNTQGYIYGNVTAPGNNENNIMLVLVDSEYFLEYYGNRTVLPRTDACPSMFKKIDTKAWDPKCNQSGPEDFLRKIPCPKNKLCTDEVVPDWVLPGFQFTFRITNVHQPRFWYISTVSCFHNSIAKDKCIWSLNDDDMSLNFDIWFVNGHPFVKHINPFEHQFSFEMHDVFEIYFVFFIVYCFLIPVQCYALHRQKHFLPMLLTMCICMEFFGVLLNLIHVLKFAFDGSGLDMFKVVGNFIDNAAQCLFMLLLLLIIKGWTITRMDLLFREKVLLFSTWTLYTMAVMALFIWNLVEIDIISDKDEWQTRPGYLLLGFRVIIMIWFLYELRGTLQMDSSRETNEFYLHFGAGFLVWFVYLPIVALILSQISALWRYKTMLSVMNSADFLSYCVMTHLLWPTRDQLFFRFAVETRLPVEDLEFSGSHNYNQLAQTDSDSENELFDTSSITKRRTGSGLNNTQQSHTQLQSQRTNNTRNSVPNGYRPNLAKNSSESTNRSEPFENTTSDSPLALELHNDCDDIEMELLPR